MNEFIRTAQAEQALMMCQSVIDARPYARMGQITGKPGSGKTAITKFLAKELGGYRIECWEGMRDKSLMLALGKAASTDGAPLDEEGTADKHFGRLQDIYHRKILIVDEANHLSWKLLERLRALSDLAETAVIIVGTDLLTKRLNNHYIKIYLEQLISRVGAKRYVLPIIRDDAEFAAYLIKPRFGQVAERTARRFRQICKGNWRVGLELGDACQRLMNNEGMERLTKEAVETAATWLAGQIHQEEADE